MKFFVKSVLCLVMLTSLCCSCSDDSESWEELDAPTGEVLPKTDTIWEVCDILRISGWKHPTELRSDLIEVTSKLSFGSTLFLPSASYGIDSLDTVVIGSRVFIKCKIVPRFSGLFFFRRQSWCRLCAWWIGCCRYCLLTLIRDLSLKAISLLRYSVLSIRFISFHCSLIIYLLRRYYFF